MRISDWSSDVCSSDLQKATTNNSKSGAGCHKRKGKSEIIQIKIRVNQMKNRPDGRLKGDVSMGCSALRPERVGAAIWGLLRSEEHTSELQSLMRISYAVFCLKKNIT